MRSTAFFNSDGSMSIARSRKAPANARVAASIGLLDRGWGRPDQAIAMVSEVRHVVALPDVAKTIEDWTATYGQLTHAKTIEHASLALPADRGAKG